MRRSVTSSVFCCFNANDFPSSGSVKLDNDIKLAIYRHFAETGRPPAVSDVAKRTATSRETVLQTYQRLCGQRLLVLEPDGFSIRMAPPFSGVPTQHRVEIGNVDFFANCAWDALGIPAAIKREAIVHSRCEQSGEPLRLPVKVDGPEPSDWLFHCQLPAAKWWDDIVVT